MKRIAVVVLLASLLLSGCAVSSATQAPPAMDKSYESFQNSMPAAAPAAEAPMMDSAAGVVSSGDTSNAYSGGGAGQASGIERLVVKNASVSIIVKDPVASLDTIAKMADDMGGWVVTSNLYKTITENGVELPQATINVRVPADSLADAMKQIKGLTANPETDVRSENVSGEDVTSTYTDLKSRLTNLEASEASLREIMASATKTEDVLNVFNQLTQVRGEIEVIKGQMKYYEESAHFSSINVELISQASIQPVTIAGWQPVGVIRDAVQSLINIGKVMFKMLVIFIIDVLPVLAVIYLGIRVLIWIFKKLFPAKKKAAPAAVAAVVEKTPEADKALEEKK